MLMRILEGTPRDPALRSHHASAVVYRNSLVGIGFNSMKSHPFQARFGKNKDAIFLHSEVAAIKNSIRHLSERELNRSTLYVTRIKQDQFSRQMVPGIARPCAGCARAIAEFGIARVVYTLDGPGLSCDHAQIEA
jgi:tRNA(Arg) A34 adenosine deaminase TadA